MDGPALANMCLAWLCVLQPALIYGFGVLVGRHGFSQAVRLLLFRIFGPAPVPKDDK